MNEALLKLVSMILHSYLVWDALALRVAGVERVAHARPAPHHLLPRRRVLLQLLHPVAARNTPKVI